VQTCTCVASAAGSAAVTVCILSLLSVQAGANMYVRSKCVASAAVTVCILSLLSVQAGAC